MANSAISSLDPVELIQDEDLFVLEQNGESMKLVGSLLKEYINRNIATISVQSLAPTEAAKVISFDSTTGALVLGLPRNTGVASVEKTGTVGVVDTYTMTFETPAGGSPSSPITFTVTNGVDGEGAPPLPSDTPSMDGTAQVGSLLRYAAADHRHPSDTSKASVHDYSGTLPATSWSGTSAPYSKAVTVNGILATDKPIVDMVSSGTFATDEVRIEDWAKIYRVVATANTLTFYATDPLEASVPFQVRCIR